MPAMLQENSREVVAVKVIRKKTLNRASTENLLTEIEILKTVRHPHIVQLKDFQVGLRIAYSTACVHINGLEICFSKYKHTLHQNQEH